MEEQLIKTWPRLGQNLMDIVALNYFVSWVFGHGVSQKQQDFIQARQLRNSYRFVQSACDIHGFPVKQVVRQGVGADDSILDQLQRNMLQELKDVPFAPHDTHVRNDTTQAKPRTKPPMVVAVLTSETHPCSSSVLWLRGWGLRRTSEILRTNIPTTSRLLSRPWN